MENRGESFQSWYQIIRACQGLGISKIQAKFFQKEISITQGETRHTSEKKLLWKNLNILKSILMSSFLLETGYWTEGCKGHQGILWNTRSPWKKVVMVEDWVPASYMNQMPFYWGPEPLGQNPSIRPPPSWYRRSSMRACQNFSSGLFWFNSPTWIRSHKSQCWFSISWSPRSDVTLEFPRKEPPFPLLFLKVRTKSP